MVCIKKVGGAGLLEGSDEDCLQVIEQNTSHPPSTITMFNIAPLPPQLNVYVPETEGADPLPVMVGLPSYYFTSDCPFHFELFPLPK